MNRLDDKVAIITGGAQGMGAETAALFIAAGARVVITDVDEISGEALANKLGPACHFLKHDVRSDSDWNRVIDKTSQHFGPTDVLVNNAGVFRVAGLEATSLKTWDELVAINQTGTFLGIKAATPVMKARGSGSIINMSSIAGLGANHRAPAYAATKWAVRGLTKSAAVELAPFDIRVNSVHPGLIKTRMMDELSMTGAELDARVPLGRQGEPAEVAKVVLFVASDDSSYCTGHEFVVNGALRA